MPERLLTARDFFKDPASDDWPQPERVEAPWFDGVIWVRVLTAKEREAFAQGESNWAARLVELCACNQAGERIFKDGAGAELAGSDSRLIFYVAERAARLNRLRPIDREADAKNS